MCNSGTNLIRSRANLRSALHTRAADALYVRL
jgi:hypothetical protein